MNRAVPVLVDLPVERLPGSLPFATVVRLRELAARALDLLRADRRVRAGVPRVAGELRVVLVVLRYGDGKPDVAVLVLERATGSIGISVIFGSGIATSIIGAGQSIGNGGDDFRWMDLWRLDTVPRAINRWNAPLPKYQGEVLYVEKSESASAFIGWTDDDQWEWYQQGD